MRRFFSLLMCVSGMSLAVTVSQADEPAAPTAEQAPQADETEAPPPADWATESRDRFEKLRDRLQSLYRLEIGDDEFSARIEKMAKQAEGLYAESSSIAEKHTGAALDKARANIEKRFARLEASLEEAEARSQRQLESEPAERSEADAAGSRAGQTPQADASGDSPVADQSTGQKLDELHRRARDLSVQRMSDAELQTSIQRLVARLHTLSDDASLIARTMTGEALDRAQSALNTKIAVAQKALEEVEKESHRRSEEEQPAESRAGRIARRLAEVELTELRMMLEQLQQSATDEAQAARVTIEGQIDELERFLAERRERRDAVAGEGRRDARRSAPEPRLRHLNAAVEHLEAAGLRDVAMSVRKHVHELQHEIAREEIQRQRPQRAEVEQPGVEDERRQLGEQVEELRSEVRRLRAEMEQMRNEQPKVTKPAPDNPG